MDTSTNYLSSKDLSSKDLFSTWTEFFNAMKEIYVDIIIDTPYNGQYQTYYQAVLRTKSEINVLIIEYLLSLGQNPTEGLNTFVYNGNLSESILYYFNKKVLYNTLDFHYLQYEEVIQNNNHLQNLLNEIFKLFFDAGATLNLNFLYNNLPDANNIFITNNYDLEEFSKCPILGLLIDILSENYYPIDITNITTLNLSDIPAISFNDENQHSLFINKPYNYVLLSNLKFYSGYLQKKSNIKETNKIIGGNVIFDTWDDFFYMFDYLTNFSENDYHDFINSTNEFTNGFYSIIKYMLYKEYNKLNDKSDDKFYHFAQEGLNKYIQNIANFPNYKYITQNNYIIFRTDLYKIYRNVIGLFKLYNVNPNIEPILTIINNEFNDDEIINQEFLDQLKNDDDFQYYLDIDELEDFAIDNEYTVYGLRGLLLDSIYNIYINESIDWEKIKADKLAHNIVDNNDISLLGILSDYYRYDYISDIAKYADWNSIIAQEYPIKYIIDNNLQNITFKTARFMRLKFFSNFLNRI
jgi:hypothetical protein